MANEVTVAALDERHRKLEKDLKEWAEQTLLFLKQKGTTVEVYLIGAPKMRVLNRQHRGKDKATNVLAFPSPKVFPATGKLKILGEIYLCPAYARAHGEKIGALLVHGLLHLLGFNHARQSDKMRMERMEKKAQAWLNL